MPNNPVQGLKNAQGKPLLSGAQTIQAAPPGDIDPSEIMKGEMPLLGSVGFGQGVKNLMEAGRGAIGGLRNALGMGGEAEAQAGPSALYKGFQEDGEGGGFHLYDILGGERHGSTVSEGTLRQLGIPVPATPGAVPQNALASANDMLKNQHGVDWMHKEFEANNPIFKQMEANGMFGGNRTVQALQSSVRQPKPGGVLYDVLERAGLKSGMGDTPTPGESRLMEHFSKLIR